MSAVLRETELYRERYQQLLAEAAPALPGQTLDWLVAQRAVAVERFLRLGFPNRKDEAWRYTQLDRLLQQSLTIPTDTPALAATEVDAFRIAERNVARLVFVNGTWLPGLSHTHGIGTEVRVTGLRSALVRTPEQLAPWLGCIAGSADDSFTALNTALFSDGVWIRIPAGVKLAGPIEIVHISRGTEGMPALNPRSLIVLEDGAEATLVEHYVSLGAAHCFTNSLTEIALGDTARLRHYRLQDESESTWHLSNIHLRQNRDSRYQGLGISLGGVWSRTEYHNRFEQPQARCDLDGLYLTDDGQLTDFHLDINHAAPACSSRERFKGILLGRGRAVFDGRIRVEQDAQKTDAFLSNANLMLSRDAEVDSKPQLEIFADDVKCGHGTTIGQIDPAQLFYLRTRGIGAEDARRMLCLGFASELLDGCVIPEFRERIERRVAQRLQGGQIGVGEHP